MSNTKQNKFIWLVIALAGAGVVLLAITMLNAPKNDNALPLNEVFAQNPSTSASIEATIPPSQPSSATDPVVSPAIVTDTTGASGKEEGFAIQVYSFQDESRAHAALANLKANGYEPYIVISDLGEKGTWYRVRVGGIQDESQAQQKLDELRKLYKSGFIVKPKK